MVLKLSPVLLEIARDLAQSEVITFAIPQSTGQEVSVYSPDVLKLLHLALGLPGARLSTEQMTIVRHELGLHHTGHLRYGDDGLKLLWLKGRVTTFPLGLMTVRVEILERVIKSIMERLVSLMVLTPSYTVANEGLGEGVYFTERSGRYPGHLVFRPPSEYSYALFSASRAGVEP